MDFQYKVTFLDGILSIAGYIKEATYHFNASLLLQLKHIGIWCKVYRTPSTPLGYAEDLAAVCIDTCNMNSFVDIVYQHWCTWQYVFNGRKSGCNFFK